MEKNKHNKVILGTAAFLTLSVLGALASVIHPTKKKGMTGQANEFIHKVMDDLKGWQKSKKEKLNKNVFVGSIAGSLLGITTALLLAPKPGKELIHNILNGFSDEMKKPSLKKEVRVERRAAAKTVQNKKPHHVSGHPRPSVKKRKKV